MDSELEKNLRAFKEELLELLRTSRGKFAVGRADDKFTCWDTWNDALQWGYDIYGLKPFIFKSLNTL